MGHRLLCRIAAFLEALLALIGSPIESIVGKTPGKGTHRGAIFAVFDVIDSTQMSHNVAFEGATCLHELWNLSEAICVM